MPRPNQPRDVFAEDHLAQRIKLEREKRGWTYEGLAKRMTDVGCPINQSALYKVEQAQPRRRITVDELVALARVFEVSVEDLLTDPKLLAVRAVVPLLSEWQDLQARRYRVLEELRNRQEEIQGQVRAIAAGSPEVMTVIRAYWRTDAEESQWTAEDEELFGMSREKFIESWSRSNANQFIAEERA